MGALVRGYANLGMFGERQWHPAHKVFKARALLYAQRMAARDDKTAWPLYHRAYALAASGLHKLALDDFDAAEKLLATSSAKEKDKPPVWAELILAHCRYDMKKLDPAKADKSCVQLAHLLRYVTAEQGSARPSNTLPTETALKALEFMPECYRVHDGLARQPGVAVGHGATVANMATMGQKLYGRLAAMTDLPPDIRKLIQPGNVGLLGRMLGAKTLGQEEEFSLRGKLMAALLNRQPAASSAREEGELSWATLGLLIREETFWQVLCRANFEAFILGVSPDEFFQVAAPLFADHPYRAFVETYSRNAHESKKAAVRLSQIELEGLDIKGLALCGAIREVAQDKLMQWTEVVFRSSDRVAEDLVMRILWQSKISPVEVTEVLLAVSPYSPRARAILIENDWPEVQDRAAEWEKESSDHAIVLTALGAQHHKEKRYDDAIRCFAAATKVSAEVEGYQWLADCYRKQGNEEKWLSTLESFLDQPDYGLSHAQIRSEIAYYYIKKTSLGGRSSPCRSRRRNLFRMGTPLRRPLLRGNV